jgi:hypothetical protein
MVVLFIALMTFGYCVGGGATWGCLRCSFIGCSDSKGCTPPHHDCEGGNLAASIAGGLLWPLALPLTVGAVSSTKANIALAQWRNTRRVNALALTPDHKQIAELEHELFGEDKQWS